MSLILNGNRILVREIVEEAKTTTGILLSASQETFKRGEVMFAGPGVYQNGIFIPNKIHVGSKIIYPNNSDVIIEGETYQLTNDESVIAILK